MFDQKNTDTPAMVAEDPELANLAWEIKADLEVATQLTLKGAAAFHEIGKKLLLAKQKVGHGGWENWLKKNLKIPSRSAQRWMRLAQTDPDEDIEEKWRVINGAYDAEDSDDYLPGALRKPGQENWCLRCMRIGQQTAGCKACADVLKSNQEAKGKKPKREKPPPAAYDKKQTWASYNRWEKNVIAFARENDLTHDPLFLEVKSEIAATKAKFKELQKKVPQEK